MVMGSTPTPAPAPWMSQLKKSRSKKRGKACKKQQQGQQQKDQKHSNGDTTPSPENSPAKLQRGAADVALPARLRGPAGPARPFIPSAARELVVKMRRDLPRRGINGVSSDMMAQLRALHCPFMWGLPRLVGDSAELYSLLDSTPYRPTPWHMAVQQIHYAFEFARLRMLWKSRELLEDVYALLGRAGRGGREGEGDELLQRYRAGLTHVLDGCWLFVREDRDARDGKPLPDGRLGATPFDELDAQQRASVWAIKAIMAQGDSFAAKKALELDPTEGQWVYVKGLSMRAARARKRGVDTDKLRPDHTSEERSVFLDAFERRRNPQTMLRLARCFVKEDADRCIQLVRSALEEYSWSAYVYLRCGRLFDAVERAKESKRDTQQAQYCLRRAMSMAPDWMRACLEYGLHCMDHGNHLEGYMYVNKASRFFPNLEFDSIFQD